MIQIFYGPKEEFQKIISKKKRYKTLTELAVMSDQEHKAIRVDIPGQERSQKSKKKKQVSCLIAYSEDYAGISETGMQSFLSFVSEFSIKDMYLHNPPIHITEQLQKARKELNTVYYEYDKFTMAILQCIYDEFDKKIIGQKQVKEHLVGNLYSLAKQRQEKPVVLMFYGPSGVGKTETAKFLSGLFGDKLFRKQFSMYQSNEFADYIFGAKHYQSSLAKDLLNRNSNIILFDEFDKPNPIFFSAFYQMFDEGVFVDKNYSVDLSGAVIICTSNYKSEDEIKKALGEPIFSRFDDCISFARLSPDDIIKVIQREFEKQYSLLDAKEMEYANKSETQSWLISKAKGLSNVRHVQKVVKQAIITKIIENSFNNPNLN